MQYLNQILRFQEGAQLEHAPPEALVAPVGLEGVPDAGDQVAILIDLSPPSVHRSRELRALVFNTYVHSSGSAVARLRRALAAANRHLMQANEHALPGSRFIGSISCAVFAADEVFIGQVGTCNAFVVHADPLLFPAGAAHALEVFPHPDERAPIPLGVTAPPDIRIGYTVIGDNSTLLLATTAAVEMLPQDQWQEALGIPLTEDVVARVRRAAASNHATGAVILIRSVDTSQHPAAAPVSEPKPRRRLFAGRKRHPDAAAGKHAQAAVITSASAAGHPAAPQQVVRTEGATAAKGTGQKATLVPIRSDQAEAARSRSLREAEDHRPASGQVASKPTTAPSQAVLGTERSETQRAGQPMPSRKQPQQAGVRPASLREKWERWRRASKARRYKGRSTTAERAQLREAMRTLLPATPGSPAQARQRKAPTEKGPLMGGLALGLALITFLVASTVYLRVGEPAKAQEMVEIGKDLRIEAYESYDPAKWRELLDVAERILALDATNSDARKWREEAQEALRNLDWVKILDVKELLDLGATATPRRLLAAGSWVYMLNTTTDEVIGLRLNADPISTVANAPTLILRRGQTLNGEAIEHLVDLAWITPNNNYPDGALLIYSEGGALYLYEPGLAPGTTTRQRLLGNLEPEAVSLMETFGEKIYLVQRRDNQILVYDPVNGIYESARGYFPEDVARDLELVLDIAIDGRIYLLSGKGTIYAFMGGTADRFEITGVPDPALQATTLAVDTNADAGYLYLGDAKNGRIVVLDKNGAYKYQYRVSGNALRHLETLAIGESPHMLYFVAANRLYAAPLPELNTP